MPTTTVPFIGLELIIEGILTLKGYKNGENEPKVIVKKLYPFLLA